MISELADPGVREPAPINMLLGASVWALIVHDGSFVNQLGIAFQPSQLGWLLFGGGVSAHTELTAVVEVADRSEAQLNRLLRRFWEIEEISVARIRTIEQERCEEIFVETHRRLPDGRFQVDIPLRDGIEQLGSSRAVALHRYRQLERRFERDPALKNQYMEAINDLLRANLMRLADRPPTSWCYHILHHAVLKKFRIVNNASCVTDRGISLNDAQLIGGKLQDDLADLIMRFRCRPVAITAVGRGQI